MKILYNNGGTESYTRYERTNSCAIFQPAVGTIIVVNNAHLLSEGVTRTSRRITPRRDEPVQVGAGFHTVRGRIGDDAHDICHDASFAGRAMIAIVNPTGHVEILVRIEVYRCVGGQIGTVPLDYLDGLWQCRRVTGGV